MISVMFGLSTHVRVCIVCNIVIVTDIVDTTIQDEIVKYLKLFAVT